jgi:hypothetical protein
MILRGDLKIRAVLREYEDIVCDMILFVAKKILIRELFSYINLEEFPSGQRGQTVNLLSTISMVRIHLPPPILWEHSSAGRASALQAEGHRFDPCCSHHYN